MPPGRLADLGEAQLSYCDSGGDGGPVILLHPFTGSAAVWANQYGPLLNAGFRVVAYSRRGHGLSSRFDAAAPGHASGDLLALADRLGLSTFSLVGSAAGCSVALDVALTAPHRVTAMILACGRFSGLREPEYVAALQRVRFDGFDQLPVWFRELGPSYRALDPDGVARWRELESRSRTGSPGPQLLSTPPTWKNLATLAVPTHFVAGAADLCAPPATVRLVAERCPGSTLSVLSDSGHSAYWEEPDKFNSIVADFLHRQADAR